MSIDPSLDRISKRPTLWRESGRPQWWREAVLVVTFYGVYEVIRAHVGGSQLRAQHNGAELMRWETHLHIDPEHWLNTTLSPVAFVAVPACYFYASAYAVVTSGLLIWTYRHHPSEYRQTRTMLGTVTALALVGFWWFPTAPPRLLSGGGFIDTLARYGSRGWWGSADSLPSGAKSIGNQFAAMPSLHVAWSLWCGWVVWRHVQRNWLRMAIWSYPIVTILVVITTANHYLLDAVAGAALWAVVTFVFTTGLPRRKTKLVTAIEWPPPATHSIIATNGRRTYALFMRGRE